MKKIKSLLVFSCFIFSIHAAAQTIKDSVYKIDASLRLNSVGTQTQDASFYFDDENSTKVLVNKQLYKGALLKSLKKELVNDKSQVKLISVEREPASINKYISDTAVIQLVRIKASRKLARKIKKQYLQYLAE